MACRLIKVSVVRVTEEVQMIEVYDTQSNNINIVSNIALLLKLTNCLRKKVSMKLTSGLCHTICGECSLQWGSQRSELALFA